MPEPDIDDDPPKPAPRRPRPGVAVIVLIVIGVLALAGGATGLTLELTRPATPAEAQAAAIAEVASRWQRLPAGQIFPAQLSYQDLDESREFLTRTGIARPAACAQAADAAVAQVLVRAGCVTVLRATYVDASGVLAVTVGVAVMRSTAAALHVGQTLNGGAFGSGTPALDAYPVPGTTASRFGNPQRQQSAAAPLGQSRYLVLAVGGFTDGRPRTSGLAAPTLSGLVDELPADPALSAILTHSGPACTEHPVLSRGPAAAMLALVCALGAGSSALPALAASSTPRSSPLPSSASQQLIEDLGHAWQISQGQGVTVAVLSTGVDPSIPGLKGRVTTGPDFIGLKHPLNILGSIVAGIIAGDDELGSQTASGGLAPRARILSIRVGPDAGEPGASSFYDSTDGGVADGEGVRYAASHGAQVIFIDESFAGEPSPPLDSAVRYAIARGAVIVSEDMNYTSNPEAYHNPEDLPGVIGVGAVQVSGNSAPYDNNQSSQNQSILVAAPSNTETEPIAGGQLESIDGPEAAAAVVAGVVALVKSAFPHLSPALVGQAIALSARDRPAGGYNTTMGFGLINPEGALREAAQLSRATHTQAAGGQAVTARFRSGPLLPAIEAVHHAPAKLAGYGAAIVVGLLCLAAAPVLWWRRSRRGPAGSEQLAEPQ